MTIFRFLCISTCLLFAVPSLSANEDPLIPHSLTQDKESGNMIEVVKIFLGPRAIDGNAKIWVFFTDKNVFDKNQFSRAASEISMTERARQRRIKMGRQEVTFADLPVHKDYILEIETLGAKLRRQSRWLNAASFDIPLEAVDLVNSLPFVSRIRPMVGFFGEPSKVSSADKSMFRSAFGPTVLNYGISQGQLDMINVPAVHELGVTGAGVLVGMFDTGFRKDHIAFSDIIADGRLLAEYDFVFDDFEVQNEVEDVSSQHNHGTYTWSTLGGESDGSLYGPAYGSSFLLAKTEDLRSETPVEEDNWLAAVEWADSIGVQVISSSLSYGYNDWYDYSDLDGETAIITQAANLATSLGIVVCNSMANSGPGSGTLGAPADALEILSIGAVNFSEDIASFSSRGPTYDGRIKPEVCAQGVSTYCASASSSTSYSYVNGTSLSTPLVGGAVALILSARPSLTPQQVRLALMNTADNAATPDNTYGWGVIDVLAALNWGADFYADIQVGQVPLDVNFFDSSHIPLSNLTWDFGDGETSSLTNPNHIFEIPGLYNVSLSDFTDGWVITETKEYYVLALADTLVYSSDTVFAGDQAVIEVYLANTQPLTSLYIPYDFAVETMTLDTFSVTGGRASDFTAVQIAADSSGNGAVVRLVATGDPLAPGQGSILRFFFSTDPSELDWSSLIDTTTVDDFDLDLASDFVTYIPAFSAGLVAVHNVMRGDANADGSLNVGDPVFIINNVFKGGPLPDPFGAGDVNVDDEINVGDVVYLINYIFKNGPPPMTR
ncbi:MAG: S8 family serine peptidase [FCB group bacterium]|nr:S8 family serine peptidase [FCB group bacterium]